MQFISKEGDQNCLVYRLQFRSEAVLAFIDALRNRFACFSSIDDRQVSHAVQHCYVGIVHYKRFTVTQSG
jgi:hypothetical protein